MRKLPITSCAIKFENGLTQREMPVSAGISLSVAFCSTTGLMERFLEDESRSELDLTLRTLRRRTNAERWSTERSSGNSKRSVVEDVEELSAKLHFEVLSHLRIFYQRHIVVPPRSARYTIST